MKFTELDKNEKTWGLYMNQNVIYISSVFYGDVTISAVIMIIAVGFIVFLDKILNISLELVFSVKLLFFFVFLSFVITTVGTSYTAAAYIKNRLDIVGVFRSLSYVLEVIFYIVVFSFTTPEVWQVGVAICIAQLVIFGGNYYIYKTPFIVINADDYYGKEGFKAVHEYLVNGGKSCMLQLLLRLGTFQLSDIFYNTVGGVLGGLMYCAVMKAKKRL